MAKVDIKEIIGRLPVNEQVAIHARSAKITAERAAARQRLDQLATAATKMLPKAA